MHRARQKSRSKPGLRAAALTFLAVLAMAFVVPLTHGQTLTTLYSFPGDPGGANPWAGVTADAAGNFYGTTLSGGSGYGTVYELPASGAGKVLHSFSGSDGELPYAAVLVDKTGNLYGTTYLGGAHSLGVVYKLSKSGKLTVLHSFAGGSSDGCNPFGGVTEDTAGNLYGTTVLCGAYGYGTLWRITKAGKFSVRYNFRGGTSDGLEPSLGNLLMDSSGNLYGFTILGGLTNNGVLYELSASGKESVIYAFGGGTGDGCFPQGTPAMDASGAFYGITEECGSEAVGVAWTVSKAGKETVLHNFVGGSDGSNPYAGVTLDTKGNFYGTTEEGGNSNNGVVYKLSIKNKKLTILHAFDGSDGSLLFCGLVRDAKGNFYGTTYAGGASGYGTVWKLTP